MSTDQINNKKFCTERKNCFFFNYSLTSKIVFFLFNYLHDYTTHKVLIITIFIEQDLKYIIHYVYQKMIIVFEF
jgi:hypothetical protein